MSPRKVDIPKAKDTCVKVFKNEPVSKKDIREALLLAETESCKPWAERLKRTLEERAESLVSAITQEKIDNAPIRDLAYTADIMIKNKRLLDGESTAIIDEKIPDSQIIAVLENLYDEQFEDKTSDPDKPIDSIA